MSEWEIQVLQLVIVPILIGLLTSLLFLLLIRRVRPNIQISENIAKVESKKHLGKYGYVVKILNKSKRSAVDIKVRFAIVQEKIVPDGIINRTTDFELEKDSEFEILGFNKKEPEASAFRFLTYDDLEAKCDDDNTYLLFVVYAKDSLTGFGKVFTQKYYKKRVHLKDGSFKVGTSMEIA
jgi:hypothetical protein